MKVIHPPLHRFGLHRGSGGTYRSISRTRVQRVGLRSIARVVVHITAGSMRRSVYVGPSSAYPLE